MTHNVKIESWKHSVGPDDSVVAIGYELDISAIPPERRDDFVAKAELRGLSKIMKLYHQVMDEVFLEEDADD